MYSQFKKSYHNNLDQKYYIISCKKLNYQVKGLSLKIKLTKNDKIKLL